MKKYLYLLLMFVCIGFVSCGGDDDDNNNDKPNNESPNSSTNGSTNSNGMKVAEAVDLGLSVKWASWNVGASAPEDFGNYYAWGELEPKTFYQEVNYSLEKYRTVTATQHYFTSLISRGNIADDVNYDVAAAKWGAGWCMPSKAQFEELLTKCSHGPSTSNGVKGELFVGPNNNTIFLPYCGKRTKETFGVGEYMCYWTSTNDYIIINYQSGLYGVVPLSTSSSYSYVAYNDCDASSGLSIRPVKK